ncbi:DNA polymerase III subunit delta [bacterium]|nr:DNA polymerase III subunit delta [bacterium]
MGYRKGRSGGQGFQELVNEDLKKKVYRPVYVLAGEDTHRMEGVIEKMRKDALGDNGSVFNYHVLQGDQVDVGRILQQALALPMLGSVQLIWVKNADRCLGDKDSQDALERYIVKPVPETILVLTSEKVDKRKKWVKTCQQAGYLFDFAPPTGDALVQWCLKAAEQESLPLTREQAALLCDLVGSDLLSLKGEISKLALLAEDRGGALSTEELNRVIMDQAALEGYEITNALGPGRAGQVLHTWFRLAEWGRSAYEIAPLLVSRVRKGQILAAGRQDGLADNDIAVLSGQNPFALKFLTPMTRAMGAAGLSRSLRAALACERRLKGSPLKPDIVIEKLILDLCEDRDE